MKSMMALTGFAVVAAVVSPVHQIARTTTTDIEFPHPVHTMLVSDCATCHAVSSPDGSAYPAEAFCGTCHNGSVAPEVSWTPPPARVRRNERFDHARHMEAAENECVDCHTVSGESSGQIMLAAVDKCMDCHEQSTIAMASSPWHGGGWVDRHASDAAASPQSCASCHVRQDCLDCHRPGAASGSPGYHRADFLTGHATAAYSRETSCNDCHSSRAFCTSCHVQAGLAGGTSLGAEFHDIGSSFVTTHGQVARQSLETCITCHSESDCVRCHSTSTGRINPHGPGWDGDDLREKNPRMCLPCHGG
jgi:hypothetical protein